MKNEKMIIPMTTDEIKANPFVNVDDSKKDFYHFVCSTFVDDYDKVKSIDCTKVNVAKNIEQSWFDYVKEHGIESYQLAMMLLMSGPKAVDYLDDNCVEVKDGAIEW